MNTALLWFVRIWIGLIMALNALAVVGIFIGSPNFSEGWLKVQDTYSPLNVGSWLVELMSLAPVIGACFWLEHRQKRKAAETESPSANF
jgi:hypothetical protein